MKKAFTLIELVLIIILIAILAKVGMGYTKTDYLQKDVEYFLLQIKKTKFKAMGAYKVGGHCLSLDEDEVVDGEANEANPYKFRSTITSDADKLCFDEFGRAYKNDINPSSYMKKPLDIELEYKSKSCTIKVYPLTGYGIISCD